MDKFLRPLPHPIPQPIGHIGMGLKTAGGDSRSNGRQDILPPAAVVLLHPLHPPGGNAQCGTPPSCMDGTGHPLYRVAQQYRDAVGGKNTKTQSLFPCDQTVGLHLAALARERNLIAPSHLTHNVRVDLMVLHQGVRIGPDGMAEAAEVLAYPLGLVSPAGSQVQAVPGSGRQASHPGGKAVGKARLLHLITGIKKDAMALLLSDFHSVPSLRSIAAKAALQFQ